MSYDAPTIVGVSSATSATNYVDIATTSPAPQRGDLLLLFVAGGSLAAEADPPSDSWEQVLTQSGNVQVKVWRKFAQYGEPSSYRVIAKDADAINGHLVVIRGIDGDAVVDSAIASGTVAPSSVTAPAVTTQRANSLVYRFLAFGAASTWTAPSMTLQHTTSQSGLSTAGASETAASVGDAGSNTFAGSGSTDDYVSLSLAISPGALGLGTSLLWTPQNLLADTLAATSEFQSITGTASADDAKASIYHDALPPPPLGADDYSQAELVAMRPFALISTIPSGGLNTLRDATESEQTSGRLMIEFELNTPDALSRDPGILEQWLKTLVGRIIVRPDGESSSFNGLLDLFHTTSGSQSYLAGNTVTLSGLYRTMPDAVEALGDFIIVELEVGWGSR